jgi:uncharacterized repeat protein (TIGR03837 family)
MAGPERWDIFCRVVDNFGDVGVSWRLARQVAREHGKHVRLWLDDLTVLSKLRPEIDPVQDVQELEQVTVERIREPVGAIADVVVETFGCDPPEPYVHAMAAAAAKPRWINLEYLSAEEWVERSHALPSPNPRLPLVKHYFFPGFTPRTGGLLREESLLRRRDEFRADAGAQAAFWRLLVGRAPPPDALKISLFTYAGAPVESLARACAHHAGPVWLVAPEGIAATALEAWRAREPARGSVECITTPFLAQDRYDELLWACDVNFVRGEDSFVRAQWAARPFVWHIYPQDEGAHYVKLAAFLRRYTADLDRAHAAAVTSLWEAWNRREEPPPGAKLAPALPDAWAAFVARREAIERHASAWAERLARQRNLAETLVDFADNVLK